MDFRNEIADFPSAIHRCVYAAARGITPLNRSLPSVKDPVMAASCADFHGFIMDMLSDMYDQPEAYHLPVMELESFCGEKTINAMKQKFPSRTKVILSHTRNAVHNYMMLLYMLGKLGTLHEDALFVSQDNMKAIEKTVNAGRSPIPAALRFSALECVGLVSGGEGFISGKHPKMFPAMRVLAAKADKLSGFDFFAFRNAEFRNIDGKYKPTPEDYFYPLAESLRKRALELHEFALQMGMRPSVSTFWKVDYKYKGAQVMCVGSEGDHERLLDIRVVGTYNWDDPDLINGRLIKEPPAFQRLALRRVWRCDACSTSHLGRFVTVLGKRQRVCGGGLIGFRFRNPGDEEMDAIRRLLEFRREIIDEIKEAQ